MRKNFVFYLILVFLCIAFACCEAKQETPLQDTSANTEADTVFEEETEKASAESTDQSEEAKILAGMTLREKIGQLFLARNPKTMEEGIDLIAEKGVCGIIFFGRDFKSSNPEEFRALIASYSDAAKISLLTSVDEEGGDVCRVSNYKAFRDEKFLSPSELYSIGGMERILSDCDEKSAFLLSLGLNFNLAPVADISTHENDFIHHRALGEGRDETAEYASSLVRRMNENGIISAVKHFPGYGNNEDTHTGIAYDKRSLDHLMENDLVPFAEAIKADAPVVMVSHNVIEAVDGQYPASLSPKIYELLRSELGFDGVIMTDDLSMGAIGDFTESGEAAVLAIEAGADLLCCSDIEAQYAALLDAVESGRISIDRIEESVLRLVRMKLGFDIICTYP
ncbi:MAG: beta-hexosaminidase [Clostridia bacterium]|nr:beta-hexosaminidase [Clostridia bacterium]